MERVVGFEEAVALGEVGDHGEVFGTDFRFPLLCEFAVELDGGSTLPGWSQYRSEDTPTKTASPCLIRGAVPVVGEPGA